MTVNLRHGEIWIIIKIYFNEYKSQHTYSRQIAGCRTVCTACAGCLVASLVATHTDIIAEDLFWQISHIFVSRKQFSLFVFSVFFLLAPRSRNRPSSTGILWKLMSDHLYLFCSRAAAGIGHSSKSKKRQNGTANEMLLLFCAGNEWSSESHSDEQTNK